MSSPSVLQSPQSELILWRLQDTCRGHRPLLPSILFDEHCYHHTLALVCEEPLKEQRNTTMTTRVAALVLPNSIYTSPILFHHSFLSNTIRDPKREECGMLKQLFTATSALFYENLVLLQYTSDPQVKKITLPMGHWLYGWLSQCSKIMPRYWAHLHAPISGHIETVVEAH